MDEEQRKRLSFQNATFAWFRRGYSPSYNSYIELPNGARVRYGATIEEMQSTLNAAKRYHRGAC